MIGNFVTILFCFKNLAVQRSENRLITTEYYLFPAVFLSNNEHITTIRFQKEKTELLQHTNGMQVTKDAPRFKKKKNQNPKVVILLIKFYFHSST